MNRYWFHLSESEIASLNKVRARGMFISMCILVFLFTLWFVGSKPIVVKNQAIVWGYSVFGLGYYVVYAMWVRGKAKSHQHEPTAWDEVLHRPGQPIASVILFLGMAPGFFWISLFKTLWWVPYLSRNLVTILQCLHPIKAGRAFWRLSILRWVGTEDLNKARENYHFWLTYQGERKGLRERWRLWLTNVAQKTQSAVSDDTLERQKIQHNERRSHLRDCG